MLRLSHAAVAGRVARAAPAMGAGVGAAWAARRFLLAATPVSLKDVRKGDRGDARRLTFQERSERRTGKTHEKRAAQEDLLRDAEALVNDDLPGDLEAVYVQHADRANTAAMKVLNMAKCLERLSVDVGGGRKVLLLQTAQVVKTGADTLEVVPTTSSFVPALMQHITRFDSTLQVTKEPPQKIRIRLLPVTTARRDKAAEDIRAIVLQLKQKVKHLRTNYGKALQDTNIDEHTQRELERQVDDTVNAFVAEKVAELELLAEEVVSMGVDESDV